jgi:hypothetical protein
MQCRAYPIFGKWKTSFDKVRREESHYLPLNYRNNPEDLMCFKVFTQAHAPLILSLLLDELCEKLRESLLPSTQASQTAPPPRFVLVPLTRKYVRAEVDFRTSLNSKVTDNPNLATSAKPSASLSTPSARQS